jgi:hypothetical protein
MVRQVSEANQIKELVPTLQYLALSPDQKETYSPDIDPTMTFHMSEADASFQSFCEFMLAVAESQIGKIVGYIEMGNPEAITLSDEQFAVLRDLWQRLDDALNYRVSEMDTTDLSSDWWRDTTKLAHDALHNFGQPVQPPLMSGRYFLDQW